MKNDNKKTDNITIKIVIKTRITVKNDKRK
jgi:hypothetical protein